MAVKTGLYSKQRLDGNLHTPGHQVHGYGRKPSYLITSYVLSTSYVWRCRSISTFRAKARARTLDRVGRGRKRRSLLYLLPHPPRLRRLVFTSIANLQLKLHICLISSRTYSVCQNAAQSSCHSSPSLLSCVGRVRAPIPSIHLRKTSILKPNHPASNNTTPASPNTTAPSSPTPISLAQSQAS